MGKRQKGQQEFFVPWHMSSDSLKGSLKMGGRVSDDQEKRNVPEGWPARFSVVDSRLESKIIQVKEEKIMKYQINEKQCGFLLKNGCFVKTLYSGIHRYIKAMGYEVVVEFMNGRNVETIDNIEAVVDFKVVLELLGIGLILTLISSLASMISIQRFSPLTILKERS